MSKSIENNKTKRKQHYERLRAWEPVTKVSPAEELFDIKDKSYPFCEFLYEKCVILYKKMPKRKNGEDSFLHPINVVINLKRSKITDNITLLCGMLHDYIEEHVDLFKEEKNLGEREDDLIALDEFEIKFVREFEKEMLDFCEKENLDTDYVSGVIETLKLLTRQKRDYYYKSISFIFNCEDEIIQERAIQIKLADRIHNILSIECFNERGRLYQCFKNLFIINSAKQFLIDKYGKEVFKRGYTDDPIPTERLYNRCSKATFNAYLVICKLSEKKNIKHIVYLLQLAFQKFKLAYSGIWQITDIQDDSHPMRLFQGVIIKWDARLHQEWEEWQNRVADEKEFCAEFFSEFDFDEEQIQAIIDYKDAYSLKDVLSFLLYDSDYVLSDFLARQLDDKGRLKV